MRLPKEKSPRQLGSISRDEALPLRELSRRFGWGRRQQADAIKAGLRAITIGRQKFVVGGWVLDFIEAQAGQGGDDE